MAPAMGAAIAAVAKISVGARKADQTADNGISDCIFVFQLLIGIKVHLERGYILCEAVFSAVVRIQKLLCHSSVVLGKF